MLGSNHVSEMAMMSASSLSSSNSPILFLKLCALICSMLRLCEWSVMSLSEDSSLCDSGSGAETEDCPVQLLVYIYLLYVLVN